MSQIIAPLYLCFLGMPKCFTSSSCEYIKTNFGMEYYYNNIKEPEILLSKKKKLDTISKSIIDGTQSYLFSENFINNFNCLDVQKAILIIQDNIVKQYERLFNMHFQSASSNNQLAEKIIKSRTVEESQLSHQLGNELQFLIGRKNEIIEYRDFVGREVTDGEILHFFTKKNIDYLFRDETKVKMELIINGDIDRFCQLEIKRCRDFNFEAFSLLPFVMLPWVINWLGKYHLLQYVNLIKFQNEIDLQSDIDKFFSEIGIPKIDHKPFPHIKPREMFRINKSTQLSSSLANILLDIEQKYFKDLNLNQYNKF